MRVGRAVVTGIEKLPSEEVATELEVPLTVTVAPETGVFSFEAVF